MSLATAPSCVVGIAPECILFAFFMHDTDENIGQSVTGFTALRRANTKSFAVMSGLNSLPSILRRLSLNSPLLSPEVYFSVFISHFIPGLMWKVYVKPSLLTSHLSAIPGLISPSSLILINPSKVFSIIKYSSDVAATCGS